MGYIEDIRPIIGHRMLMVTVSVVLIFDEAGRVLLERRADNGHWSIVGGIIEPGETVEDAARREVFEEVGLRLNELTFLGVASGPDFTYTYPNGDLVSSVCIAFAAKHPGEPFVLDPGEVSEVGFFPIDALPAPHRPTLGQYLALWRAAATPDPGSSRGQ